MKYLMFPLLLLWGGLLFAQSVFSKGLSYKTNTLQEARRIIRTPDNQFLVVGYTTPNSTSLNRDGLVFKMDADGEVVWAKFYGGNKWEEFYDVTQVGNYYYCVGYTRTFVNGTFMSGGENVNADVFLIKIKLDGTLVWAKNMGKPANGTSATDGNDIGLRLLASGQGGVVIVVRINSGSGSNQNGGMIWVDADGKTKWANRYDLDPNGINNELTFSLWKDDPQGYITGGYIQTFSGPTLTGGMTYKVNQLGDLVWNKNTRCTTGVFESQYYGYYNHSTGKMYTTDYFSQTSGSVRESQVCTNIAATGNAPNPGTVPRAKRFYYVSKNHSSNFFRSLIFPIGDGYEEFILATHDVGSAVSNSTKYANLIAVDKNLNFKWSKKVGATHSSSVGFLNQIQDMVTCDGTNQSLMCVGTLNKSNGNKVILVSRIGASGTLDSCDVTGNILNDSMPETSTNLGLTRTSLNTTNCGNNCWADNDLIPNGNITIVSDTLSKVLFCQDNTPANVAPIFSQKEINNIFPLSVLGGAGNDPNLLMGLSFEFLKIPKEVYFEITDVTGDFVYLRFFGNVLKLKAGFNFAAMNLKKGQYMWEIEAVYDDEKGIERKTSEFKIE